MSSFKLLFILCVLINVQLILANRNCDSSNCKQCLELVKQQNPNTSLDELNEYCVENGDRLFNDSNQVNYDVYLRVYNLSDKINETFGNDG